MNLSNLSDPVNASSERMPSNASNNSCGFTDDYNLMIEKIHLNQYGIVMPIYFVLGTFGRLLTLLAFYHQAKVEAPYLFQIFVAVIELIDVVAFTFYTQARYVLSGVSKLGQSWFWKCWFCMYVDAHFSSTLQMATNACALFLSLCMTLDRIYALAKPIKYRKKINRKREKWSIFIICIIISFIIVIPVFFVRLVTWNEKLGMYKNVLNMDWIDLIFDLVDAYEQLKLAFIMCLAAADIVLAILFRKRMKERAKVASRNDEQEIQDTEKVRMLFWLTFIQSILRCLSSSGGLFSNTLTWMCLTFNFGNIDCFNGIVALFCAVAKAVPQMAEFYVVFALMPSFRKMVISSLKITFKINDNKVTPLQK